MQGGLKGALGSTGGLARSYGLQRHFTRSAEPGPSTGMSRATLQRIAGYFRPYRRKWMLILLCIAAAAGLNVLPPLCVGAILDRAIPNGDVGLLGLLAGAMVALAILSGLVGVLQQSVTADVGQSIMFDLRGQLYRHLQRMSLHFYTANRSGEIVSRINNDVAAVQGVTTATLVGIAGNLATLVATSVALLSMNWRLALVAVVVVPAFYVPSKVVGRMRHALVMRTQEGQAALLGFLSERLNVSGALLTKIFGRRDEDASVFASTSGAIRDLQIRQAVVGRWLFMILSVLGAMGPALVYWYGGYQVIRAQLTPGLLVAFAALLGLLYRPLMQLATVFADIRASIAVFDRIFEYLDREPELTDRPDAVRLPEVGGHLAFEGVGMRYPDSARADQTGEERDAAAQQGPFAIRNVSFEILPGQRVALVGPSGAGKTTLTYLAARLYDPCEGRITLDGVDLRDLAQDELRSHIAVVPQETFLFHDTIRANLRYAKTDALEEEIADACRAANIHEFISGLPDGYETVVGERGHRLSGGEKQRLSIARAILKDPAILIMDEATSQLDASSEALVQEALGTLLRGRTSLLVAHRLSTILSSDMIVVVEAGAVVEAGRHDELLARGGLYSELFEQQFGQVLGTESRPSLRRRVPCHAGDGLQQAGALRSRGGTVRAWPQGVD